MITPARPDLIADMNENQIFNRYNQLA